MNTIFLNSAKFFQKKHRYFDKIIKKKLLDEKRQFIAMNMFEWEKFAKFILEINKELKESNSIRHIILSSAIATERFVDMIFVRIYNLDKYKKFNAFEFLSHFNFHEKIEFLRRLQKLYRKKCPKTKEYKHHITYSLEFFREVKKKYGQKLFIEFEEIEEELNKRAGIQKPNWAYVYVYNPKLRNTDYLPDDITAFIKRIDIGKLEKIRNLRNIVAHKWNYREELSKYFKIEKKQLKSYIKSLCLDILNQLGGLYLR